MNRVCEVMWYKEDSSKVSVWELLKKIISNRFMNILNNTWKNTLEDKNSLFFDEIKYWEFLESVELKLLYEGDILKLITTWGIVFEFIVIEKNNNFVVFKCIKWIWGFLGSVGKSYTRKIKKLWKFYMQVKWKWLIQTEWIAKIKVIK